MKSTSTTSAAARTSCDDDLVHRHGPRRERDLLAGAHPLVGTSPVDLDRGDRRRHLLDLADEPRQGGADVVLGQVAGGRDADDLALGVVGGGGDPEPRAWRRRPSRSSIRCPSSRVARPTPSTSTPVAIGSSVPAWPTLRVPRARRARATTSCEVSPPGLSTTTRPVGPGPAVTCPAGPTLREVQRLVVEVVVLGDLAGLLVRVGLAGVRLDRGAAATASSWARALASTSSRWRADSGSASGTNVSVGTCRMPELLADLGADQPLGRLQGRGRAGQLLVLAQHGVEDRGLLGVAGDADVGDGDEAEPRVLDPPLEHLGHDHLDPVGDLAHPRAGHVHLFVESRPPVRRVAPPGRSRWTGGATRRISCAGSRASRTPRPRRRS